MDLGSSDSRGKKRGLHETNRQAVTIRNEINNSHKFIPAEPVQNVQITSFYSDQDDTIKFNVSWNRSPGSPYPKEYSIKVSPLNYSLPYCESDHYETHMPLPNSTYYVVPPLFSGDLKIIPECTYRVEVIAGPNDAKFHPDANYTVPVCVDKLCSCKDAVKMPDPKFIARRKLDNSLYIEWNGYSSDTSWMNTNNVTYIHFKVGEIIHNKDLHDIVHNQSVKNENLTNNIRNIAHIPNLFLNPSREYLITAFFENQHHCTSKSKTFVIGVKPHQPTVHWILNILIPILCFIMFIGFIIAIICRKTCIKKFFVRPSCSPPRKIIYRPTRNECGRRSFLSIPMEFSTIYIEKEIEEEIERGKADKYEVCYSRLQFGKKIGGGAFGQVFLATVHALHGKPGLSVVAVKKLKQEASPEQKDEFLIEIDMLKKIGHHPNIVRLLGCCTIKQPYCMLMEYTPCGDLLHYLHALRNKFEKNNVVFQGLNKMKRNRNNSYTSDPQKLSDCSYIVPETSTTGRPSFTETEYTTLSSEGIASTTTPLMDEKATLECVLDAKELQSFAIQIARGMEHLESKQIIHRDLAARNILIDENRTLKISDFGFSRTGIYVNTKNGKVPLRWLSVEAIRDNLYTNKSDVWAYGVVLWEIGTLGGFPYPVIEDKAILPFLLKGSRLERPENCTNELYSLMLECWAHHCDNRPSFKSILQYLESITNSKRVYVDFSNLNPSYVFPPTEEQTIPANYAPNVESIKRNLTIEIVSPNTNISKGSLLHKKFVKENH